MENVTLSEKSSLSVFGNMAHIQCNNLIRHLRSNVWFGVYEIHIWRQMQSMRLTWECLFQTRVRPSYSDPRLTIFLQAGQYMRSCTEGTLAPQTIFVCVATIIDEARYGRLPHYHIRIMSPNHNSNEHYLLVGGGCHTWILGYRATGPMM